MKPDTVWDRRRIFQVGGRVGAGLILGACAEDIAPGQRKQSKSAKQDEEIGPTEDLMREHGVLNRVLLIYDHFIDRMERKERLKPESISGAANVIRSFIEDYHERQEEQFVFPRFEKAGRLIDLVSVLRAQ